MTTLHRYSGFALRIDSELELPELPELRSAAGPPDVVIRLGTVPFIASRATLTEEFAFNKLAGAFRIRNGCEIVVDPLPGGDPDALRLVLLGRIMAFLLKQRGWLPLHASCVVVNERAVLFLASSGEGKSTTAAAFHARGYPVIADDVGAVSVVAGRCMVRPAWSRLRLFEDASGLLKELGLRPEFQYDKQSYDLAGGRIHRFYPVGRIYALESGSELRTHSVSALESVSLLSRHSFSRHAKLDPEALSAHLRDCAAVAGTARLFRMERPRSLDALGGVVSLVEKEVASE